jgi:predicted Zn-dependent protease
VAPDNPHISDTLGWILYQRGLYDRAASLLKDSAAKLPNSPAVQYHYGMAALKTGDKNAARKALGAALSSPVAFPEMVEAKQALSDLN